MGYSHLSEEEFARYMLLFGGNTLAYGTETGGCVRQSVHEDSYRLHLVGEVPLGIYPMVFMDNEWMVRWGCIDLDVKSPTKRRWDFETQDDAWIASRNLELVLAHLDIHAWTETTKSGGYHVWVFTTSWVHAADMRRALLVACQLADVPPSEVNPKSEGFDDPMTLGNYVRLPYKGWDADRIERPIVDGTGDFIALPEFIDIAWANRTDMDTIQDAAALWVAPQPVASPERVPMSPTRIAATTGTLSRRLQAVVTNGPLKKEDRSGWLYYVARLCSEEGLSQNEAVNVLQLCDEAHTQKFTDRADGDRRLAETVGRAYQ